MTTTLTAYIGRDNEERIELLQDGTVVPAGAVTRAVLRSNTFCIDSAVDTNVIYFADSDNQTLCIKAGLIPDLTAGIRIKANLTLYDALNVRGVAWVEFIIKSVSWDSCSS